MRASVLVASAFVGAVIGVAVLRDRQPPSPELPDSTSEVPSVPAMLETLAMPAMPEMPEMLAMPEMPAPKTDGIGHLILQIEGDARSLRVTWITPKSSAFNRRKTESAYQVELLDAAGDLLGTYPLDLAPFDLDPARVGQPLRVDGCEVRDPRVATVHSVPWFAETATIQIRRGGQRLGQLGGAELQRMIEAGRR